VGETIFRPHSEPPERRHVLETIYQTFVSPLYLEDVLRSLSIMALSPLLITHLRLLKEKRDQLARLALKEQPQEEEQEPMSRGLCKLFPQTSLPVKATFA